MIPRSRKARVVVATLTTLILVAGAILAWALTHDRPGDVTNTDVAFETAPTTTVAPPPVKETAGFEWPIYGYTPGRGRNFPLNQPARPPFVQRWAVRGNDLLEFGPGRRRQLAVPAEEQRRAVRHQAAQRGRLLEEEARQPGGVVARLPQGRPVLHDPRGAAKGSKQGRVVAFNVEYPRVRWARTLPSRTESSPLVVGDTVYVGSENGTVYALRADDGLPRWTYKAERRRQGRPGLRQRQAVLRRLQRPRDRRRRHQRGASSGR